MYTTLVLGSTRMTSQLDPDDVLVFDQTYGVVPSGVLKQWK